MELEVLYEDNHIIAVNKPYGYLVHADKTGDRSMEDLVRDFIRDKYDKPGNVFTTAVHRLDRPVSGVLILAKTSKGKERMSKVFSSREVEKEYWALSDKYPNKEKGSVELFLQKNSKRNFVSATRSSGKDRKSAITRYELIGRGEPYFFFKLYPLTGRSHQLRVTMKHLECPIVGDVKYDGTKAKNSRAIFLHCHKLTFMHPVKKEPIEIMAPLPNLQPWHSVWHLIPENMRMHRRKPKKDFRYRK